jgi:hypothetical protein
LLNTATASRHEPFPLAALSGFRFPRNAVTRLRRPRAQVAFNYPLLARAGCAAPGSEATRAVPRARGTCKALSTCRQVNAFAFSRAFCRLPGLRTARQHPAALRGSQSAYKAKTATAVCLCGVLLSGAVAVANRPFSKPGWSVRTFGGVVLARRGRTLFNSAAGAAGVVTGPPRSGKLPFPAPIFIHLRSGESRGRDGREACKADICRTISDGLGSEHGGAECVAMRGGTGAQGAPI